MRSAKKAPWNAAQSILQREFDSRKGAALASSYRKILERGPNGSRYGGHRARFPRDRPSPESIVLDVSQRLEPPSSLTRQLNSERGIMKDEKTTGRGAP